MASWAVPCFSRKTAVTMACGGDRYAREAGSGSVISLRSGPAVFTRRTAATSRRPGDDFANDACRSLHLLRGYKGVRERAESLIALSREHGQFLGFGLVRLGRIAVDEGSVAARIETMLEGMRAVEESGQSLAYDYFCCVLAERYLDGGADWGRNDSFR